MTSPASLPNPRSLHVRIYHESELPINHRHIDENALRIVNRLRRYNHTGYLVGGAVRDLLIGKIPKDFDIATDASPQKVRAIFSHSRIIGKRFRLVHVYFRGGKIIEVATFRSLQNPDQYGTIEEDAMRRDFTVNGLFYDPANRWVIDYVNGVNDIDRRRLTAIIPLDKIFVEDPMRMLRAIKYATLTNLKIGNDIKREIRNSRQLLADASRSRITEEVNKILLSGASREIFLALHHYNILQYIQPRVDNILHGRNDTPLTTDLPSDDTAPSPAASPPPPRAPAGNASKRELRAARQKFLELLRKLDGYCTPASELADAYTGYLRYPVFQVLPCSFQEAFAAAKEFIAPVTPAERNDRRGYRSPI